MNVQSVYLLTLTPEQMNDLRTALRIASTFYLHARQGIPFEWQGEYHPQVARIDSLVAKLWETLPTPNPYFEP
jgi:hypothetical protein